jgi:hypothetical protein
LVIKKCNAQSVAGTSIPDPLLIGSDIRTLTGTCEAGTRKRKINSKGGKIKIVSRKVNFINQYRYR